MESAPLLRGVLFRLEQRHHIFAVVCDHLVIDGWSMNIFWSDFLTAYRAELLETEPDLAPVSRQFGEYAVWQRERLSGARLAELHDFWRSKLSNPPAPASWKAVRGRRPSPFSYRSSAIRWTICARDLATMRQAASRRGASLFSLINAMFTRSLTSLGARNEILIHTPSANRRNAEFNGTIGYLANGIILRVPANAGASFAEDLAAHAHAARQAYAYGEFPLAMTRLDVGRMAGDLES